MRNNFTPEEFTQFTHLALNNTALLGIELDEKGYPDVALMIHATAALALYARRIKCPVADVLAEVHKLATVIEELLAEGFARQQGTHDT